MPSGRFFKNDGRESGEPGPRKEGKERPYREVALIYDELVGDTAFELWKSNFEELRSRYGLSFETAADIACGTGNAVCYLAESCSIVYGVDASPEMLEVASAKLKAANVVFMVQSFTELELPEPVDLLTCNFDSLNYLVREDDLSEAINRFASSVNQGGYCLFDMNTTRELQVEWGTSVFLHRVSMGLAVWESYWDPDSRINTLNMTNFLARDDGLYEMSEEIHRERAYDTALVVELLRGAGFSRTDVFDAKGLTDVTEETRRVQFLAYR